VVGHPEGLKANPLRLAAQGSDLIELIAILSDLDAESHQAESEEKTSEEAI
jgi:hypothetical protein